MTTCEHCQDRLLDHAYGLLEEGDLQEVHEHLSHCVDCQAVWEEVRADQQLLATAAKAITVVPEFATPASALVPLSETVPLAPSARPRRSAWQRPWLVWSAAAAFLVGIGASLSYYRQTVHGLQAELASQQQEYKKAATLYAALPAKYADLHDAALRDMQAKSEAYLHVVGPTTLLPGAKGHLHITTRNQGGQPAKADLRIKLMEAEPDGKTLQVLRLSCNEQSVAELDASKAAPNSVLKVIVEADVGQAKTRVQETLRTLAPSYAVRLDTSKLAYQVRDVLFFRAVVLDRYTLLPPAQPVAMRVELLNSAGQPVRSLDMPTGDGGIVAREFAIDDSMATGSYVLRVRPADTARRDVPSVAQPVEIVRELSIPDLVFNQERVRAGDQLSGIYRGAHSLPEKAMVGGESVPITKQPSFGGLAAPGGAGGGAAKGLEAKKQTYANTPPMAQPFTVPIPANLPPGARRVPITIKVGDGAKQREIHMEMPVAPSEFSVDFFPEGGDLIAGVENRVYYRVRSKSGESINGDGSVILLSSKNDVVDSPYQLGMGYFDFVPATKESYTVRITTPVKTETVADPFGSLGIRTDGVVVHVPNAVGNQGEPIRLTLRQQGPARKLLLVANCRGQIVDQRLVEIRNKNLDLTLRPTQDAVGMIRITAYEFQDGHADRKEDPVLVPVAERLVYRGTTQRLNLGFQLNTQQLRAGKKLDAKITAHDEKGQPAPAWLLASVIDERFQTKPRTMSAHFLLLNEVRGGADLDNAQLLLRDSPESVAMLERFLGTHGWRRFVRSQEPSLDLLADSAKRPPQPLVFSRENQPLVVLQEQVEARLAAALTPIRLAGERDKEELEHRVATLVGAVKSAAKNLHDFEEAVQGWFRLGLGMLLAFLLAASLILMGVGIYRIFRAHRLATPSFGSAFACLMASIGLLFFGNWLGPLNVFVAPAGGDVGPAAQEIGNQLDKAFAQAPPARGNGLRPLTGGFALSTPALDDRHDAKATAIAQHAASEQTNDVMGNLRFQLGNALARRDRAAASSAFLAEKKNGQKSAGADNLAMNKRFEDALPIGKAAMKSDLAPPPMALPSKQIPAPSKGRASDAYTYQYGPNLGTDTLYWHPTLWLPEGRAEVQFDMAAGQATYRVLLLGHCPAGRFGFYEMRLDVPEVGR